ncbi:MAG: hypothetical protein N3B21_04485 [Clostridia bacterium]|nr:hypothetical protein [Clostridia bacterium]
MYVIYIRNYKKKVIFLSALCILCSFIFFLYIFDISNKLAFNVSINNHLTFSYPFSYEIDNVYISQQVSIDSIETGFALSRPLAQKFSNYESLKGKFSFKYPSIFTLSTQDFSGSEILYHIDFKNKTQNTIHGFVQVWNLPYSLKEFLEKSQKSSPSLYKNFKSSKVRINNIPGYLWDYTILTSDRKNYRCVEVFLQRSNLMYRISYFSPESLWNKAQSDTFWSIAKSFKLH